MVFFIFLSAASALLLFGVYKIVSFLVHQWTSPLHDLPGPKSSNLIFGNMKEIWKVDQPILHEKWAEEYGPTLRFKGLLNANELYTMDTKALNHILMSTDIYQKPEDTQYLLSRILGTGVLITEGEKHRTQRKIMNPAFGPIQIRALTEIFVSKSIELRDAWTSEIFRGGTGSGPARVEVLSWLSKMTLDVIGLAGFNYSFNALNAEKKPNELNEAFSALFRASTTLSLLATMKIQLPFLRMIETSRDRSIRASRDTMLRIGSELMRDAKQAISEHTASSEKTSTRARDLFSLLIKANMQTDLKGSQRLSDEDVLSQVPTFLVAGHETTSTATTWALYALSKDKDVQSELRDELLTVSTDEPTMEDLNALPYLDRVVRETLRIYAPIPDTSRVAVRDDVIPLDTPFIDKNGEKHDVIRIRKGDPIMVPILALNRSKHIWGKDALEFKPSRWESIPENAHSIPGIWGNMLTFLGGPRACIGYRFSLVETKALLYTLIRAFEFDLAVPDEDIAKHFTVVMRPMLRSDAEGGCQMPLLVKPYQLL